MYGPCGLTFSMIMQISDGANFGRSVFERLSSLGYNKHLLNIQYRTHPEISKFPIGTFYDGKISNGPNVSHKDYNKRFLAGKLFRPYSFINIDGDETAEKHDRSLKNSIQVAVIVLIMRRLFKETVSTGSKLSVGIVSPYNAQVRAIQEKIGKAYGSQEQWSWFSWVPLELSEDKCGSDKGQALLMDSGEWNHFVQQQFCVAEDC
ncbi:unnamed protein product [Urochloa humidicola]